ncbi:MAG: enoyl-CoA hydratase/isomerase family protein [Planctomycetaceae bacterium]|nr:enoyl-CoA hydratase/isomerase family protein [Planctomycetaceae bacterium]
MSDPLILLNEEAGVVRLTLNRPQKRNALTRELLHELRSALREAVSRTDLRLLVLRASGTAFCAGMDLAQMQETSMRPDATEVWRADTAVYGEVVRLLFECPCPTLAIAPGPAVAGGLGLLLACDLVIASEAAFFALPEPKRGITAAIVTPLLVYRLGASAASFVLLSGLSIDAARAREMGLCHQIASGDDLDTIAGKFEQSVLTGSPEALALTKRQLRNCAADDVLGQLEQAEIVSAQARETVAAREGLQAFLEKRNPAWSL